ncbi:hypothetical protein KDA_18740 [Dictyobacter alpinus]|uniref:Peptidase C51 domain-containing protein n=1 Tax=Dictyobacter alpinus TaxID=2014873 RepID=A0A402B4X3_9CHLR|nr:CHAP domain-containing protein [Dictyobacter alpinus]GCE26390.1 hypothetical protein KDA_18740 [Dictyobacter alpinus]
MPKTHSISQFGSQHRVVSMVAGQVVIMAALALMLLGTGMVTAQSASAKANTNMATQVATTANVHTTSAQVTPVTLHTPSTAVRGRGNYFPWGQCTYYANMRYYQLHGIYVPWTINSNAYQWVARAYDYGWHVSATPTVGSIMVLGTWTQGTGSYGHVAIVNQVLSNGRVLVSQMNWAGLGVISQSQFRYGPGSGVSFITDK